MFPSLKIFVYLIYYTNLKKFVFTFKLLLFYDLHIKKSDFLNKKNYCVVSINLFKIFLKKTTKKGNILKYSDNEFKDAKNFPVIVHFAGEKPRKKNCFHPLSYLYHQYRSEV